MQWANLPDLDDVPRITEADYMILRDIRAVLERHEALDQFGINLLHKHFDLGPDEILVEYTDEQNRTLTSRVEMRVDVMRQNDSIETNWTFDRNDPLATLACKGVCVYNRGHSRQHG